MRRRSGLALIMGLLLTVFLLVLGLAFLSFTQQDYSFSGHHKYSTQAYYLAVSGLNYYRVRSSRFSPNKPQIYACPPGDTVHFFRVTQLSDMTVRSTGYVVDSSGRVRASRTLVVPHGDFSRTYDESQ